MKKNFVNCIVNYKLRTKKEKEESAKRIKKILKKYLDKKYLDKVLNIIDSNFDRFTSSPGSYDKHQPWEGGYFDHLEQLFIYAIKNYDADLVKHLPKHEKYLLSDVILVLFFHDIEKPFKYVDPTMKMEQEYGRNVKGKYISSDKEKYAESFGIKLEDKHRIALHYVHGENDRTYSKRFRRQSPLGAAAGNADRFSARVLFNVGFDANGKAIRYKGDNLEGVGIGTLADII